MTAASVPAVFGLNKYLWAKIKEAGITDETATGGLVPIIPNQEEPQFLTAIDAQPGLVSAPYLLYSWYTGPIDAVSFYKQTDFVTYCVNSLDQTKLRQLFRLLTNQFKRFDDSASAVNRWLAQQTPGSFGALDAEYRAYRYNYISVAASHAGKPNNVENDPVVATVTLRVNYTNTENDLPL